MQTTATHRQPTTPLDRYLATAQMLGCPSDQLRAFRAVGYVAQPMQLRFHAACRAADSDDGPTKIGLGGARGPGKSHAVLAQIGADDCQRLAGSKWLMLRKVGKAAHEGFEDFLLKNFPPWMRYWKPSRNVLAFPNGSRIIIGHFQTEKDVDAYLGLEYDGIGIEEATQLSRAKLEMIATVNRTSKPGWRPRMYYSWNPGGVGHAYIKQLFVAPYRRNAQTDTRFIPGTVRDNKHVNPEYRRTLEQLTGWRRAAWLDGDMDIAAGQYFTNWLHPIHVRSGGFRIPPGARVWCSLDYGFTHYTVVYLFCRYDGMITVVDEHAERRKLPPWHSDQIKAMLDRNHLRIADLASFVAGRDVFAVGKDSQGKTIADQYAEQGITLTAADDSRINGAGELLTLLGDYEAKIAHRIELLDRCTRLIACLPAMEHDPHRPEDVLKVDTDDNGDGGDDPYDACRYGVMDVRSEVVSTIPAAVVTSAQLFGGVR
jgi:phage terminase large subunit